jgi:hypothetical protein
MKKIYISGKITGLSEKEFTENFSNTEAHVKNKYRQKAISINLIVPFLYWKYPEIINPLNIKPFLGIKNWWCYMITDLYHLSKCDAVYMMDNAGTSRGARIELAVALLLKKQILSN